MNSENQLKKVAILGTAPSLKQAPFDDIDYDIWAVSPVLTHVPDKIKNIDVIYEMHGQEYFQNILKRLNDPKVPVYMVEKSSLVPESVKYPLDEIQDFFKAKGVNIAFDYFTNSVSFMIAMAICQGYDHISLYGVDMAADSEYKYQRPNCEYWLGIAQGFGIDVYIPQASPLIKHGYMYAYNKQPVFIGEIREKIIGLKQGIKDLTKKRDELNKQIAENEGAIKALDLYVVKRWE